MKISNLLATLLISSSFFPFVIASKAHACEGNLSLEQFDQTTLVVATHPSVRCPWQWGDDMTNLERLKGIKNFKKAQQEVSKIAEALSETSELLVDNVQTEDRNKDGITDKVTYYDRIRHTYTGIFVFDKGQNLEF